MTKLNKDIEEKIKEYIINGKSLIYIAKKLNINRITIYRLAYKKRWIYKNIFGVTKWKI